MRYWDTSALVPLVVAEEHSELVRQWFEQDSQIVTWAWSRVELVSAIERRAREKRLSRAGRRLLLDLVTPFAESWDEVADVHVVRSKAIPLLARHALRAADAAQVAAALVLNEASESSIPFLSLDQKLAVIAEKESLRVYSPGY